jgi:hypothetical protein
MNNGVERALFHLESCSSSSVSSPASPKLQSEGGSSVPIPIWTMPAYRIVQSATQALPRHPTPRADP